MSDSTIENLGETTTLDKTDVFAVVDQTDNITKKVSWLTMLESGGYYRVDASEVDQGLAGNGRTIKAFVDSIGASKKATILLPHDGAGNTTVYTLTTSEEITDNITLVFQRGAIIDGTGTLTFNSIPIAGRYQIYGSSISIVYNAGALGVNGIPLPEWYDSYTPLLTETRVFDDFYRSNRTLQGDMSASGHTWVLVGTGQSTCSISNGIMVSNDNVYAYLPFGTSITTLRGVFSFVEGSGDNDTSYMPLTLIADNSTDLTSMLHLNFGATSWNLSKRVSGEAPPWTTLLSGTYNLVTDGTKYRFCMSISGNTVTVISPDGKISSASDNDILTIDPQNGALQIYNEADSHIGRWHGISIGDSPDDAMSIMNGSASPGDIGFLKGTVASRKQRLEFTTPATIGWYRVAIEDTFLSYVMSGRVLLSAAATSLGQTWEFLVNVKSTDDLPAISNVFASQDTVIDQVRVSTDPGNNLIALDIHLSLAQITDIIIDFEGIFNVVNKPAVGATALTANENTLIFGFGVMRSVTFTTPATIGWYRIATEASLATWVMFGEVRISARNASYAQYWIVNPKTFYSDASPNITQRYAAQYQANIIDQIRLSTDSGNELVGLDIHLRQAVAAVITIEAIGHVTLVGSPSVGATVLPTGAITLDFDYLANQVLVRGTPATGNVVKWNASGYAEWAAP